MASLCLCEPRGGGDLLGERCDAIPASRGGGFGLGLEWTFRVPERFDGLGLRLERVFVSLRAEGGRLRAVEPKDLGSVCHGLGAVRERGLLAFARARAAARSAAATAARRAIAFFTSVADVTDPVSPRM